MALTAEEQRELDELEYEKLSSEKHGLQQAAPAVKTQGAAAGGDNPDDAELPLFIGTTPVGFIKSSKAKHFADRIADMGIRAAGPTIGQAAGALGGPFAEITVPAGGFIGGVAGEFAANAREGTPNTAGKLLSAGITGAVPGAPLAKAGLKTVAKEAAKYGAAGLAGKTTELAVDRPEDLLTAEGAKEIATSTVASAAGAPVAKVLSKAAEIDPKRAIMSLRDAAFKAVRDEGVKLPPHMTGSGTDALSSMAGPVALEREAADNNLLAWQKMAREDIGLSKEPLPLQPRDIETKARGDFQTVRDKAAEPYAAIQKIQKDAQEQLDELRKQFPPGLSSADSTTYRDALNQPEAQKLALQAGADVDALKKLREDAQDAYQRLKNGDSTAYEPWQKNMKAAEAMENQIEHAAASAGDPKLLERLRKARETIAKTYSIENATNRTTGLIEPAELAAQYNAGVPLTGNLKKIADFENSFDKAAVDASKIRNPNVGKITALGAANQASRGDIPGVLGAITTMTVGKPLRKLLLSDFVQNRLLSPREKMNFAAAMGRYIAENSPDSRRNLERAQQEANAQPEAVSP